MRGSFDSFAIFEIDSISRTSNLGLPILSIYTTLVFLLIAFEKFSVSSGSTKVVVIPYLGKVTLSKL